MVIKFLLIATHVYNVVSISSYLLLTQLNDLVMRNYTYILFFLLNTLKTILLHCLIPFKSTFSTKYYISKASTTAQSQMHWQENYDKDNYVYYIGEETPRDSLPMDVGAAYKRVDKKVKPVPGIFPEDARVIRQFPEDPLKSLSSLPTSPPTFSPSERLTQERLDALNINADGMLWPEEVKLFQYIFKTHDKTLAFEENHRGTFREDYFSPYIIPVIPHVPWEHGNIPIPPGIKNEVIQLLKEKKDAGVYEPSQASYRSRWFCVVKKNGKLRIVHDLQTLNSVTIRDAGLPPVMDDFIEPFAGRQCYTVFDLFWGFDARKVAPSSRDLTSFATPLGLLRITSMPMGFTNSPAEFQTCMVFILQDEIPQVANIFIDDLPIKGPVSQYLDKDGQPETIVENPGIRRFIWEHANDVHRIMHRIGHAGATFSPKKTQICQKEVVIVGQKCTPEGRLPDDSKIEKILRWPQLKTVKDVRGFLGLCGTVRIWIKDYSAIARPLTELTRMAEEFIWDQRRQEAFDKLKNIVTQAPALRPIDYMSEKPVILSVDSSKIAAGFILSQLDDNDIRRPARYGSIPMNERESNYSQPKLELYGLFRALRHYRLYIIGVKNFHVEVDAKYIKGMLNEPDLQPNATINRWIQGILLFNFKLIHVPAVQFKGPDALSRKEPLDSDFEEFSDTFLDDIALLAVNDTQGQLKSKNPEIYTSSSSEQDKLLQDIYRFLVTLETPEFSNDEKNIKKKRFLKKSLQFFVQEGKLYKRGGNGPLKVIMNAEERLRILTQAHEELGHRGELATQELLKQRFYWPFMRVQVKHHIQSCHECQVRSVQKIEIPLTVSTPATIFIKIHVDVMLMPVAKGFRYIVAARDDLSRASEGRALKKANANALAQFFWEQVLCRYGAVGKVITDNGPEVKGAFQKLMRRYGIPQIQIAAYNSKANGVVERGHFIIRESILKACKGKVNKWPEKVAAAFFADKVTTTRSTGCSPYYLLHGVEPVLPLDLFESTFLVQGFKKDMSTTDMLTLRIQQLEKREEDISKAATLLEKMRFTSKEQFERRFARRISRQVFSKGELVLMRNSQVEKEMNRKSKDRYLGPFIIVKQVQGGAYELSEVDGSTRRHKVAPFRLIPYIARNENAIQELVRDQGNSDNADEELEQSQSDSDVPQIRDESEETDQLSEEEN